jgi:hypothetical protein
MSLTIYEYMHNVLLLSKVLNAHKCFGRNNYVGAYAVMETNEDVKMNTQVDEINAYSFLYPVELPGKKFSFKWYFSCSHYNILSNLLFVTLNLLFGYLVVSHGFS